MNKIWIFSFFLFLAMQNAHADLDEQFQVGQPLNRKNIAKQMNIYEATAYCRDRAAHLPSLRELADVVKSFGAKGIVPKCDSDRSCGRYTSTLLDIGYPGRPGIKDSFYFSGECSVPAEFINIKIWSSSFYSIDPYNPVFMTCSKAECRFEGMNMPYIDGSRPKLRYDDAAYEYANVLCIRGPSPDTDLSRRE
jgi:hypothetical protein